MAEEQARINGITRKDVADELLASFEGKQVGVYREKDKLIPIVSRPPLNERDDINEINDLQIWSPAAGAMIPMRQVISGVETVYEDPFVSRENRQRTITVHADRREGVASVLFERVKPKLDAIPLKEGYVLEHGGEYESSSDAQASLASKLPLFALIMFLIVVFLFNALKTPTIIFLMVPFSIIGVAFGLLLMGQPFGFMAILGTLSLSGMLIKNAIVLIDQINLEISEGKEPFWAVIDSGVSRMRPVAMAAIQRY